MEKWLQEAWEELGYNLKRDLDDLTNEIESSKKWGYDYDDIKKPKKFTDMGHGGLNGTVEKECKHEWVTTGRSPITNDVWENCKHCDIAREDVE